MNTNRTLMTLIIMIFDDWILIGSANISLISVNLEVPMLLI